MADRVHPMKNPPATVEAETLSSQNKSEIPSKPADPTPAKPVPPPGTYVVQVAKDQIYRYPPPENARRYQKYSSGKPKRSCCCRCLCWTVGLTILLVVLIAVAAGVLYLVFRPEIPKYSVDGIAVRGFNLTSASSSISPAFDVSVRAQNPNDKIGIYYEKGSSVRVYYTDIHLCDGVLPAFYQPSNNVTVFQTALKGSNVVLTSAVQSALVAEQKQRNVPFRLNLKAPVKIKVGAVKTWTITVKVKCDVTVDNLTAASKIVSKDCDIRVKPW